MQRENLKQYYADNVGLIHVVAKKGHARLMSIGASYGYEDLFQELSIIFIKSYDGYNDNTGFKFSTYFTTSAYRRVNVIADKFIEERLENKVKSVEELSNHLEDMDAAEMIPCPQQTPEERCISMSAVRGITRNLSPLAHKILEMTIDPPEFMEQELKAKTAHAELARSQGFGNRSSDTLSVAFVCSVLDKANLVPPLALREARAEIKRAAQGYAK